LSLKVAESVSFGIKFRGLGSESFEH